MDSGGTLLLSYELVPYLIPDTQEDVEVRWLLSVVTMIPTILVVILGCTAKRTVLKIPHWLMTTVLIATFIYVGFKFHTSDRVFRYSLNVVILGILCMYLGLREKHVADGGYPLSRSRPGRYPSL